MADPITTRVETTLDVWLSENPEAQEMISLIDLSNELFGVLINSLI